MAVFKCKMCGCTLKINNETVHMLHYDNLFDSSELPCN